MSDVVGRSMVGCGGSCCHKIISYNIRGLGGRLKKRDVRQLVKCQKRNEIRSLNLVGWIGNCVHFYGKVMILTGLLRMRKEDPVV